MRIFMMQRPLLVRVWGWGAVVCYHKLVGQTRETSGCESVPARRSSSHGASSAQSTSASIGNEQWLWVKTSQRIQKQPQRLKQRCKKSFCRLQRKLNGNSCKWLQMQYLAQLCESQCSVSTVSTHTGSKWDR